MSISRRTARTVRILGVASASAALALGVAGNALACTIGDFDAVASCDGAKAVVTVSDTDRSANKATVTIFLEDKQVGSGDVTGQKDGKASVAITLTEDWVPGGKYRAHIDVPTRVNADTDVKSVPSEACAPKSESPSPSASPEPSESTPSDTPSDSATPSDSESSAAPATPGDNQPSAAAGESNLAETGANSNTPMIAGIAGAFVIVGGGAVYFGMRRRGTSKAS
ncbi:LAETG motif-containing sortase-dependent surface protein [Streptomyces sp. NPDC127077]|uniref:LAETG motif-containing sortase-dependent surface protein n=1 Tax=Streptomyces sp. NPDC127077 TaxID=3347131 RepID=UPI003646905C